MKRIQVRPRRFEPPHLGRRMRLLCALLVSLCSGTARALAADDVDAALSTACDGTADAGPALQAALDERTTGGVVVIPSGRTCRLSTPVAVRSRIDLRCEPGARVIAASETNAALFGSDLVDVTIDDCEIEIAHGARGAIELAGRGLDVHRVKLRGEENPSAARPWVTLDCAEGGSCRIADIQVSCAETSHPTPAAESPAVRISVGAGGRGSVRGTEFRGCSRAIEAQGSVAIVGNAIRSSDPHERAVGISVDARRVGADISDNEVRVTGPGATGIAVRGVLSTANGNRVHVEGEGAVAFAIDRAAEMRLVGNHHSIGGGAAGYRVRSSNAVVIGSCTGSAGDSDVHVQFAKTQQLVVDGCVLRRGAYGVVEMDPGTSMNVTVSDNRMIRMTSACVIAATGFTVTDNYCAWLIEDAPAVVLGDDRLPGIGNVHAVVSGNIFHCEGCKALIVPTPIGGRCRSAPDRPCRESADCRSEQAPGGDHCDPARLAGLVVTDNSFLGAPDGVGIDFGNLTRESSPAPSDLVIANNQFSLRGQCIAVRFPESAAVRSRIRGVEIGVNSNRCPKYLEGFSPEMSHPSVEAAPAGTQPPAPPTASTAGATP
jgi:hypothetical protein